MNFFSLIFLTRNPRPSYHISIDLHSIPPPPAPSPWLSFGHLRLVIPLGGRISGNSKRNFLIFEECWEKKQTKTKKTKSIKGGERRWKWVQKETVTWTGRSMRGIRGKEEKRRRDIGGGKMCRRQEGSWRENTRHQDRTHQEQGKNHPEEPFPPQFLGRRIAWNSCVGAWGGRVWVGRLDWHVLGRGSWNLGGFLGEPPRKKNIQGETS